MSESHDRLETEDACQVAPVARRRRGLLALLRDTRAVAAVEFALLLPFMAILYLGSVEVGQGVAIARMAFGERQNPVGAVSKYFQGDWTEPGLGGRLSPVFPAAVGWQQSNTDSFWGPSVHWNTYLESYVVLLNHACCAPNWPQEGIYIAYNPDLSDPAGWSAPYKILGKVTYDAGYCPQVIGTNPGESDTVAGQVARLYVHGRSDWTIVFSKDGPPATPTEGP